jgi:hypothetical protein
MQESSDFRFLASVSSGTSSAIKCLLIRSSSDSTSSNQRRSLRIVDCINIRAIMWRAALALLAVFPVFSQDQQKTENGSIVVAPIPVSSPAVGSGLILVSGYVFKPDAKDTLSPPSFFGLVAAGTSNGSHGGILGGRLYLKENKYQTTFLMAKGRVNYDFFGIGRIPNREAVSVALQTGGTVFYGEFLRNVGKNIFIGGGYQYRRLFSRRENSVRPGGFEVPPIDLQANSAAIGVHVQRDTRDSTFYPVKGELGDVIGNFFDSAWGSRRVYQTYRVAFSLYREIAKRQVVAYQAFGCSANGNVPFYDLCWYGVRNELRGYTGGEFQDRRMFTTQAEYRLELPKRLGLVAFGGIGGIAPSWGSFDRLLPGGGAGLRFNLNKKHHINYRIDFAVGRQGHTVSIGVGEAF